MLSLQRAAGNAAKDPQPLLQLSERERVLLQWYRQLDDNRQANVLRFVSAMAMAPTRTPGN